tara:strand:+ start:4336 stop:5460 length:1125 start_codon:yes stop_codon:yes gene_type:complete
MNLIAVLPEGLEYVGAEEIKTLGGRSIVPAKKCVAFEADLACFYRIHLRARLPFRFLKEISRFFCDSRESLYDGVQNTFNWIEWLPPNKSFRVDVTGFNEDLSHTHYTALEVKNALVDLQRTIWGERSSIDLKEPDFCIHLHLRSKEAVLSLDGFRSSLHRRGYRPAMGHAPIKENLAAGLIRISQWDASIPLVDPLCGSGTFLIEAASIAFGLSPGLNKKFLFEDWPDFEPQLWEKEKQIAKVNKLPLKNIPQIIGYEKDSYIAFQAESNILNAGLAKFIKIINGDFRSYSLPQTQGYLVCNPPYGKRIGSEENLRLLYKDLGLFCKKYGSGWQLWLLNGNPNLSKFIGMKAEKRYPVSNGGIDCRWMKYLVH